MALGWYKTVITTDGSGDGDNLSNGRTEWDGKFNGMLIGLRVEYDGAGATTDVTVDEPQGLQRSFLTATDNNTNTTYLQGDMSYTAGNATDYLVDSANLQVTVAQGGAANTITVIAGVLS